MRTAYKCRAYPTPEQAAMLSRTFGCVRVVWNQTLAWRHRRWHQDRVSTNVPQANAFLTHLKQAEEFAWLNEVSSVPLQQVLRTQQRAFANFFAGRTRYPRYKSRRGRQSAEYTRSGFRWRDGRLTLAKTSMPLELVWSWPGIDPAALDPTTVTVSRDPDERWYVSLSVDGAGLVRAPATGAMVGVDLGITDFAVTSDGERISNPRHLQRKAANLARYQRRMARKQHTSSNRRKARIKVARAHAKVRDARRDFLHKTSTRLVRDYDVIVVEDLAVANMVRNRTLARAISDCGWGEFRRQLEYKCARVGRDLVVVDRWFPSSKTCSACGHLLARLSLGTRTWRCPFCGTRHDRDVNAAKNILAAGRAVTACGGEVRHPNNRMHPPTKQEPQPVKAGIPDLGRGR
ncbi:RNA-guided endonuclease TnpB family protein [Actinomadura meridiana]|uniref:RNA-guided endonuclease TnpB family protein n=1 Tax=Actinomadura meridiana TaxID=559626 RepID=A0ABP8CM13_9ACTN